MFMDVNIYKWHITNLAEKQEKYLDVEYGLRINLDCICSIRAIVVPTSKGENRNYFILEMANGNEYFIDSKDYIRIQEYLKEKK